MQCWMYFYGQFLRHDYGIKTLIYIKRRDTCKIENRSYVAGIILSKLAEQEDIDSHTCQIWPLTRPSSTDNPP